MMSSWITKTRFIAHNRLSYSSGMWKIMLAIAYFSFIIRKLLILYPVCDLVK